MKYTPLGVTVLTLFKIFQAWISLHNFEMKDKAYKGAIICRTSDQISRTEPIPMVGNEIPLQNSQMSSLEHLQCRVSNLTKNGLFHVVEGVEAMHIKVYIILFAIQYKLFVVLKQGLVSVSLYGLFINQLPFN